MSTIIECPACTTRYKMNKAIPEGGRYVKCARCGNQWRLVPDGDVEETIEADAPEHNPVAEAPHEAAAEAEMPAAEAEESFPFRRRPEPAAAVEADAGLPAWLARREQFGAAIDTLNEPQAPDDEDEADIDDRVDNDEPVSHAAVEDEDERWREFDDAAGEPEAETEEDDELTAEARETAEADDADDLSDFDRRFDAALHARPEPEDDEPEASAPLPPPLASAPPVAPAAMAADPDAGLSWAQRMSRPWRDITAAIPPEPEPAPDPDEDTEASIREALRAALEQPEAPAETRQRSGLDWAYLEQKSAAREDAADEEPDYPPFRIPGHNPDADQDIAEDPPFKLSGASARRPVFGRDRDRDEADGDDDDRDGAAGDSAFQHDIEDVFRAGPLPKKPIEQARGKLRHDEPLTDFDSIYDEQAMRVPAGMADGAEDYDADTAALQAELESTDLTEYETTRRGGGLAVAAAWAMFFSIVSGLALGAVSFREEIMAALPGTSALYRSIGFTVASTGVDFADVSYRWTTAEGKPMIEVKGQVVNVTDRTVTVPRVLINVRDANSADSVKATASVPRDTLAPNESASFTLEFLSPPKNISQIELEFDQNR